MVKKASVSQLAAVINNRFEYLLADVDEAIIMSGLKTEQMKMQEDSEQSEARRELLFVEEIANKQREKKADEENEQLKKIEAQFHVRLIADIREELHNPEHVLKDVLGIDPIVGKLLDVLYTEACTISKLEACLEQLDWLSKSLIKFLRQPKYQRDDSTGNPIVIDTPRRALSFVGIESLRILLPALIAKKALPTRSADFPSLMNHLWEYTLGLAKASEALAGKENIKWFLGYNMGMFSTLGRFAIAKLYLKTFDLKIQEAVQEARNKNNPIQAKKLASLTPSTTYLVALWKKHANAVTSELVNYLKCRWLTIGVGLEDFARIKQLNIQAVDDANLHPLARLLFQCQGYMQYKMMKNNGLLSKNASMIYLHNFGVKSDDVVHLAKVNLTGLEINITNKDAVN